MDKAKTKKGILVIFSIFVFAFFIFAYFDIRQADIPKLYEIKNDQTGWENYQQGFDSEIDHPTSWKNDEWDIQIHSREKEDWVNPTPFSVDYGVDCSLPPASHLISYWKDTVFNCQRHLETAIKARQHGVIYLTPNRMIDFSQGPGVIKFSLNQKRNLPSDWIDLWISPMFYQLSLPMEETGLDLQGPPEQFIHIKMESKDGKTIFKAFGNKGEIGSCQDCYLEKYISNDPGKLINFELEITAGHLKFGIDSEKQAFIDTKIPELTWTQGVVQFGTHTASAADCENCPVTTWVWDNININPALPFTIIQANQFSGDSSHSKVTFPKEAPANSHLRFSGIGKNLQVSFDSGKTWLEAGKQTHQTWIEEKFNSYWFAVPAGVKEVQFKGEDWWGGPWLVRGISIWSSEYKLK